MNRRITVLLGSFVLVLTASQAAWAQVPLGGWGGHSDNPVGPTVSPYLNLLQTNSQGFVPYQSLVRPMIEDRNAIQRQGAAIQGLQSQAAAGRGGASRQGTGHPTFFFNTSHYYSGFR